MRIDKYLAHLNYGTRNEVKKILKSKIVTVNDQIVADPKYQIQKMDIVKINGEIIAYAENIYILYHKQQGVICANEDSTHATVFDYIDHPQIKELFCVGRLDKDTTGVLLITNDGKLSHKLLSLKHHVEKVYVATLQKPFDPKYISLIEAGINLNESEQVAPANIRILEDNKVELTLCEGKYHQVKRMMHTCDNEVIALKRILFANLNVNDLEEGTYRLLTEAEIRRLKA